MVRGRDACWEHCVLVDATRQKVKCNYCQREFSGGVYRMKFHLAQIRNKDIVPCMEVPEDVRDKIQILLNTPKQKKSKKIKVDIAVNSQQHSSSASGGAHHNNGSVGHQGSTSPSLLFPRISPTPPNPEINDIKKKNQEIADKKIAVFFYHNCIPYSATKSIYYQEMVDAVAECGVGYKAPSLENLGSTLLEKVKLEINEYNERLRIEWKETGCTILCNCCTNDGAQSILVFSVTCSKGSLFLKSADISGHEYDANYLFELIESVVLEVGIENVVQVITDSTKSYVIVGMLLMEKYTSLFWSPCASHCINKILEDFSKLEWVNTVLKEAEIITRYMYSHQVISNMMRKFTGGRELIRPKIIRFFSKFLSLRSIVMEEDNLKYMFSHSEWLLSTFSRGSEAQATSSLLYLDKFWSTAQEAVNISEPLIKLLRVIDGDMPAMGYIYEGMERAKDEIKEYYKGAEGKYLPIWEIINRKWNVQINSLLHSAAAFLNPSFFYGRKLDSRIRNGFQEALKKIAVEEREKVEVTKELPMYINAQGALGTEFATMGRTLNAPGDWWMAYGYEIPVLQKAAIRILSQPCSSHRCRWNSNTFESLHTKNNISEPEKFKDLVFVHCNLWLNAIFRSRDSRCKPVNFDQIYISSRWPTESEGPPALLDDSWPNKL